MVARLSSAAAFALCLALCDASIARAYCRTHTGDEAEPFCPSACQEDGFALKWSQPSIEYVFNAQGFPELSFTELRDTFERSFTTWERVTCDGEPIGITSNAASGTTSALSGHVARPPAGEKNENVIMHFTPTEWSSRGYSAQAFAITAVWYNPDDGQIFGADMMFNGRMDPFVICPDSGCARGNNTSDVTDLENVATHEIGHMLGLSHSDVPASTMWCDANTREISKRDLAADDISGVCAIYPPGGSSDDGDGGSGSGDDDTDRDEGCRLAERASPWGLAPLLAALLLRGVRRRRTRDTGGRPR